MSSPLDNPNSNLGVTGQSNARRAGRAADVVDELGRTECSVSFGPPVADLVGYPTNFMKRIDGVNRHVYHVTRIQRLRELARFRDRTTLRLEDRAALSCGCGV